MKEPKVSVWMLMPTGCLFLVEEYEHDYKITMGDNLLKYFDINNEVFINCSVCLGEL